MEPVFLFLLQAQSVSTPSECYHKSCPCTYSHTSHPFCVSLSYDLAESEPHICVCQLRNVCVCRVLAVFTTWPYQKILRETWFLTPPSRLLFLHFSPYFTITSLLFLNTWLLSFEFLSHFSSPPDEDLSASSLNLSTVFFKTISLSALK